MHHRSALPALLDDMLQGSIRRLMDEFEEDRALTVRIETAVRAHAATQKQRETDIELYANALLNSMIKEETRLLTREAALYGIRTRIMTRKVGKFWRSWARARGREKEQRKKDQEEMYGCMNTMGLGGSRAVSVVLHEGGKDEVGLGDMGTDHGDLGADVMLREVSSYTPSAVFAILTDRVPDKTIISMLLRPFCLSWLSASEKRTASQMIISKSLPVLAHILPTLDIGARIGRLSFRHRQSRPHRRTRKRQSGLRANSRRAMMKTSRGTA